LRRPSPTDEQFDELIAAARFETVRAHLYDRGPITVMRSSWIRHAPRVGSRGRRAEERTCR
jgi:hypothetical protein